MLEHAQISVVNNIGQSWTCKVRSLDQSVKSYLPLNKKKITFLHSRSFRKPFPNNSWFSTTLENRLLKHCKKMTEKKVLVTSVFSISNDVLSKENCTVLSDTEIVVFKCFKFLLG